MRGFDPRNLPPDLRGMMPAGMAAVPMVPLVTDTWKCPKGHTIKTPRGEEPRLMLMPGIGTPKPVCLFCLLAWISDTFPLTKEPELESKQEEEKPSGLIVPG